ncbi:uncharacterized protein PHALS_03753 [Plasmopara halstedii]|uniref:Uncharacterized protein n=1 Tax=Plasmopara halstedii TaxID=4781 RepID=A0A0N7L7H6_PLAHL|nr:uncharacterized protein PHALS_03753 [Plasmopara halstedii]CEG47099.1 hypothetical protein PHALS_03753 [Plasmopara halstedii]|eukprot:XP_024583468.1 hypothetical protein PHALS_03753 [Plasmopara halstedii]
MACTTQERRTWGPMVDELMLPVSEHDKDSVMREVDVDPLSTGQELSTFCKARRPA